MESNLERLAQRAAQKKKSAVVADRAVIDME